MASHQYVARDYGDAAIEAVFENLRAVKSTLVVMATGTGKTEVYLQIAEQFLRDNATRVLVAAHREELISQPAERWRRNTGTPAGIEMGNERADYACDGDFDAFSVERRLVIATTQTLNSGKRCRRCTADCQPCQGTGEIQVDCDECDGSGAIEYEDSDQQHPCRECKETGKVPKKCKACDGDGWICVAECNVCFEHYQRRFQKFQDIGLFIIDEAHHATADTYTRLCRYLRHKNPNLKIVGLTATPDRTDEEALGQVFESVAYEYGLPQPIHDGWLTPVEQTYILIEDLNLANVRTTAGDLNEGDLEREMMAEEILHKVTTPLIEIACGLDEGTIDELIKSGSIAELPDLCTLHEPTLIHCASVAHAERMTEILNRYLPDSAVCIVGTTDKQKRRDWLRAFGDGKHQFLLSCGVFLEGTDLPNVSIIGMARPTKSRALYAQMLGRGLRTISGLVDGVADPEERRHLIAESAKPVCQVVDFVGNSGRHKLISAIDILGDEYDDSLVEGVIRKAVQEGQPVDILAALAQAKEESTRREVARAEAAARKEEEELLRQKNAAQRAGIRAGAKYSRGTVDPFEVLDISTRREPGWHKGKMPSDKMKEVLKNAGVEFKPETTFWEAHCLIDEIIKRRDEGKCTYKQAKWLKAHEYDPDMPFTECRKIMDAWAQNGWRKPA